MRCIHTHNTPARLNFTVKVLLCDEDGVLLAVVVVNRLLWVVVVDPKVPGLAMHDVINVERTSA